MTALALGDGDQELHSGSVQKVVKGPEAMELPLKVEPPQNSAHEEFLEIAHTRGQEVMLEDTEEHESMELPRCSAEGTGLVGAPAALERTSPCCRSFPIHGLSAGVKKQVTEAKEPHKLQRAQPTRHLERPVLENARSLPPAVQRPALPRDGREQASKPDE